MSAATGLHSEVTSLHWEIDDFQAMIDLVKPLNSISLKFEAGHTIEVPTEWRFYFGTKNIKDDKLDIFLHLVKSPKDHQEIYASCDIIIKDIHGTDFTRKSGKVREHKDQLLDWNCKDCFGPLTNLSTEVLRNGTLVMDIKFKLFNFDKANSSSVITTEASINKNRFQEKSKNVILDDFYKLFHLGHNSDFKIIMVDGKEFYVHRTILGCRSPVFLTMFETNTKEASSGILQVEDLTSDAMEIVLNFIYTGKVDDKWKGVAEELIHAAEKYSMELLKEFCDKMLVEAVTTETAIDLLKVAQKFKLKTAEKELMEYTCRNINVVFKSN